MASNKTLLAGICCALALVTANYGVSDQAQAQPRTLVDQGNMVSYCWQNSSGYYFCYGPVQRTSAGERDISKALGYSGCREPEQTQYMGGSGVCRGAFFICRGTQSERYYNDENKIRNWLGGQDC